MHRTRRQVRRWPMVAPCLMELANELPMSKVMQLSAAIAPRGFVLPKHLHLMSSDAGNRARSAGLIIVIVFTDPDDAVTQRYPASHCGIHDDAPDRSANEGAVQSLGNGTAFSVLALRRSLLTHSKSPSIKTNNYALVGPTRHRTRSGPSVLVLAAATVWRGKAVGGLLF
jgi:hypothetical protein